MIDEDSDMKEASASSSIASHPTLFKTDPGVPFHFLKHKRPSSSKQTDNSADSMLAGLESTFEKFSTEKIKEGLGGFLPNVPGHIDAPSITDDSLQSLIDKPPIGGRELLPFSESALQSFRLMPGRVPEGFEFMNRPPEVKHKKKKKHKHYDHDSSPKDQDGSHERKHKKRKREEGEGSSDKKKKEKKKKKKKKEQDSVT